MSALELAFGRTSFENSAKLVLPVCISSIPTRVFLLGILARIRVIRDRFSGFGRTEAGDRERIKRMISSGSVGQSYHPGFCWDSL